MSRQENRGSAGEYQADEQKGRAAQLASIRQMSRQVSRGSAGENQADDGLACCDSWGHKESDTTERLI